jgi:hypothetical protein
MIDIDKLFKALMKKFMPKFISAMKEDWDKGSKFVINYSNNTGVNPLNMSEEQQKANTEIISELVKGVNDELSKKINYLVNKGVTENWSNEQLSEQLKGIFEKDNPNYFNYKNRMLTIASTESARVMNASSYNTAKELGYTHKYLFNTIDKRTGEDSLISHAKYDSPEDAIPINEPFKYTYKGKERVFFISPDRVNDRSFVLYTTKD